MQIREEEIKPSMCTVDMVIYVENPKECTKILLEVTVPFKTIPQ